MNVKEVSFGSEEYFLLHKLRERELRVPLGRKLTPSECQGEEHQKHFGIFTDNKAIACMILVDKHDGSLKMRQVCIHSEFQGKGLGSALLKYADQWSQLNGFKEINCHAREVAKDFYLNHGYHIEGDLFEEIGIPHFYMWKGVKEKI